MKSIDRRKVLKLTTASLLIPVTTLTSRSQAADLVDPADPTAIALGYVDSSVTDNQNCDNCQLYVQEAETDFGGCAIFPGKLVGAQAWCTAWTKKVT